MHHGSTDMASMDQEAAPALAAMTMAQKSLTQKRQHLARRTWLESNTK